MKGPYPGQILTSVGIDSNNGIYPLAYALVESENTSSWTWFLKCLGEDLDLEVNSNFTFISDRQKGIIPALKKVYPMAEHRFCVRHIHENMKAKWKGDLYKNLLWECASSTTIPEFEGNMKMVRITNPALHDWLKEINPKHWSRAFFSGLATSDVLLNNLCEVFNRQLIGGRYKPIITCLEYIMEYCMKRIVVVLKQIAKAEGHLTPKASIIFEQIKSEASNYSVMWNGTSKYRVRERGGQDQCVVDVDARVCSCRRWELIGMPCKHAVVVNWTMAQYGMNPGPPETWVSEVYWMDTWKKVYKNTINPINGVNLWTPSQVPTTMIPPKHHSQIGRPSKKRKKSANEEIVPVKHGKMSQRGNTVTCNKCNAKGHNRRSCKEVVPQPQL
ncbi:uncharacterized protein LOC110932556 [Helianthus annuus]|uniref:uncharacterized protein LOC110932556 n=1 Tax=Helianthus annuus TaxID=4232 RepID=UPI000B908F08|nr:uncharacterized protein LOC110932556 [Helianthus annuus]